MAEQLFLSADGRLRDTWRTAFPAARAQRPAEPLVGDVLVWVLVAPGADDDTAVQEALL